VRSLEIAAPSRGSKFLSRRLVAKSSIEQAILPGVEAGQLAGAAALVWRNGAVRQTAAVGRRDLASGLPVERDTIFRIASMAKPVTTVAALTLLDEGRFIMLRFPSGVRRLRMKTREDGVRFARSDHASATKYLVTPARSRHRPR
jgi:hypothetical protein